MEIKSFDRPTLKVIGEAIDKALYAVAREYDISIKRGGGAFDATNFRFKVECSIIVKGTVVTKESQQFKQYASLYGMKPEDLGKQILFGGKAYKITGLRLTSRKFPVMAERYDGRTYFLPLSSVKDALGYHVTDADFPPMSLAEEARREMEAEGKIS